jgi:AcrR family transcriptional regulator
LDSKNKILKQAMKMFAEQGYSGVSMRSLAKSVNMSAATLYHHFPDKNSLYLETIRMAFSNKATAFNEVWAAQAPAPKKLGMFVSCLVHLMQADKDFHRLLQREVLEADNDRMKLLADGVFKQQFVELINLIKLLAPDKDAHLIAISVLGLVCYHLQIKPLRQFLPDYQVEHENAEKIASHVLELLLHGLTLHN